MELSFSIDLISDLNLTKTNQFDWTGKPTSLFCVVAGNISSDLEVVKNTLTHLSDCYRGVFYIDGTLEHSNLSDYESNVEEISGICKNINNVIYMHNHIVILNGYSFVAVNGWYNSINNVHTIEDLAILENLRKQDLAYLGNTLKGLQSHKDASRVIVISSCVPFDDLLCNHHTAHTCEGDEPGLSLVMDIHEKVKTWLYGGTEVISDINYLGRHYVNNPKFENQHYYPKHVIIS